MTETYVETEFAAAPGDVSDRYKPSTAELLAFIGCCAAERTNFHVFKYGFLLFAIQVFLQQESEALRLLAGGTALVYVLYMTGGIIAQRITGEFRAMALACVVMPIGNTLVAWSALRHSGDAISLATFAGLGISLAGTALFRVNSVVVISKLYPEQNASRQAAFQAQFWAESCGALGGIVLAAFIAAAMGWPGAYLCTALLGVVTLVACFAAIHRRWRLLDQFLKPSHRASGAPPIQMLAVSLAISALGAALFYAYGVIGWITAIIVGGGIFYIVREYRQLPEPREPNVSLSTLAGVTAAVLVFGVFIEQAVSAFVLFSKSYIDLTLNTPFGQLEMAPNIFIVLSCLTIIIGSPLVTSAILYFEKRGVHVAPGLLISIAIGIISFSFLMVAYAATRTGDNPLSAWWMVWIYLLETIAELLFFPAAFSLVTRAIPANRVNAITGIWFLNFAISGFLAHRAAVYVSIDKSGATLGAENFVQYFMVLAGVGFIFVIVFEAVRLLARRAKHKGR